MRWWRGRGVVAAAVVVVVVILAAQYFHSTVGTVGI